LGLSSFGLYVTVIAWVTVLSLAAGAGMPLSAIRFLAAYRVREDWASFRGFLRRALALILGSSAIVIGIFCAVWIATPSLRFGAAAALAGAPLLMLMCLTGLASAVLQAMQHPLIADAAPNLTRPVLVTLLIGLASLVGGRPDAPLALALTVLANAAALGATGYAAWRVLPMTWRGARTTRDRAAWVSSGGALLVSLAAASLIERIDTILLGSLAGPADAGLYSAASRLALLIGFAVTAVNALLGPMCADLHARGDWGGLRRAVAQGTLMASVTALVLAVGLLLFGPWLLHLFGPVFPRAAGALATLALGQLALAVLGSGGGLLAIAGRNRVLMGVMVAAALVDGVLCVLLIPPFGIDGAALATFAAMLIWGGGLAIGAWRGLGVDATLIAGLRLLLLGAKLRRGEAA
jgi:O-antigen/teichoic acid export membrane protein